MFFIQSIWSFNLIYCQRLIIIIMEIHTPQNKEYYCPSCSEGFDNTDQYKMHYKSDYHRYNIKRKMVKLPPISLEQFSTKIHQSKSQAAKQHKCNQCMKVFGSANTFNQHVASKGHNPNMIVEQKQKTVKVIPYFVKNSKKCLFCQKVFRDFSQNQTHMQHFHSFFISQTQFCINVQGLIEYLQEKIEVGHMCITCQNKKAKDFQSGEAVRKHMLDRGHSIMKVDQGFEEYQKYYDFSRLFEEKIAEQKNIVPGISFQTVKVFDNSGLNRLVQDQGEQDEEQWQSQGDQNEQGSQMNEQKEVKKPRIKVYQIMKPTLTQNDELLLPNGKLLGHRKYRHIYRQTLRLPNQFALKLKSLTQGNYAANNSLIDRRALLELMKKQIALKGNTVRSKKYALNMGMINNKLQHYFRCSTP